MMDSPEPYYKAIKVLIGNVIRSLIVFIIVLGIVISVGVILGNDNFIQTAFDIAIIAAVIDFIVAIATYDGDKKE